MTRKLGVASPQLLGKYPQLPAPYRMIQIGQIETLIMRIDTCVTVLVPNLNRIHDLYLKEKKIKCFIPCIFMIRI